MNARLESFEEPMTFAHEPVLIAEVISALGAGSPQLIVDCTVGGAGHASALLEACPQARLLGFDRDSEAVAAARVRLEPFAERATVVHSRFSEIATRLGGDRPDAILADIGVSSHQLDTAARGFSFQSDAPLDMRMDQTSGEPAHTLIERLSERDLAEAIRTFGEERHARRVARAIKAARPMTTGELAEAVRSVVPRSRDGIDPATRTFQGIRILVNRELAELEALLAAIPEVLADNGVAAVISFHSLEDRAVKRAFRDAAHGCVCPPELPTCLCGGVPSLEVITRRPRTAGETELLRNPRSRSAKMRVARRLTRQP